MINVLQKALSIVKEADTYWDFYDKYKNSLIKTEETLADNALFQIELSEGYYIIVDFIDFSIDSFSVVQRNLEWKIARNFTRSVEEESNS